MAAGCTGDSDIVVWYAEHHCHGDLLIARRIVARWTVAKAHYWLRTAFGDEAKSGLTPSGHSRQIIFRPYLRSHCDG